MQPLPAPPVVEALPGIADLGARAAARSNRLRRAVALAVAAAVIGTVGVAAISPGGRPAPHRQASAAGLIGGLPLQQASCSQWRAGSDSERASVVSTLGRAVGGRTPYGPATTLTQPESHRLFDHVCAAPFAKSFLLYELYIRAAGFRSVAVR